jgi:hypothetical protein
MATRWLGAALQNTYVGFKPSYLPPQALLTIETAEYAEGVNESALQPWLCSNKRIAGKEALKEEELLPLPRATG